MVKSSTATTKSVFNFNSWIFLLKQFLCHKLILRVLTEESVVFVCVFLDECDWIAHEHWECDADIIHRLLDTSGSSLQRNVPEKSKVLKILCAATIYMNLLIYMQRILKQSPDLVSATPTGKWLTLTQKFGCLTTWMKYSMIEQTKDMLNLLPFSFIFFYVPSFPYPLFFSRRGLAMTV